MRSQQAANAVSYAGAATLRPNSNQPSCAAPRRPIPTMSSTMRSPAAVRRPHCISKSNPPTKTTAKELLPDNATLYQPLHHLRSGRSQKLWPSAFSHVVGHKLRNVIGVQRDNGHLWLGSVVVFRCSRLGGRKLQRQLQVAGTHKHQLQSVERCLRPSCSAVG